MKQTLTLLAFFALALGVVACAKDDNKGGGGTYTPVAACPAGYTQMPTGCTPYTGGLRSVNGPISYMADRNNPTGSGTNSYNIGSSFKSFLKNVMQVCDLGSWFNFGQSSCGSWVGGRSYHSLLIRFADASANQVSVSFRSCPDGTVPGGSGCQQDPRYVGAQASGSGGFYRSGVGQNPLNLNMYIGPANNNAGFSLYSNGAQNNAGWNRVIYVEVANGKIGDTYFDFRVLMRNDVNQVGGTEVANGRAYLCSTPNCGT